MKILVINPGSTSTKIAVFEDQNLIYSSNIHHPNDQLAQFDDVHEQYDFRRDIVIQQLQQQNIPLHFDAVIGRGGIGKPIPGGAYEINTQMIADNLNGEYRHACNLGCKIAYDISQMIPGSRALIAEPGVVDELMPIARISGRPEIVRTCIWHALNQRAVAKRFARESGRRYEDLKLIVCHIGGGISVAAHDHGLAVDVNNAIEGEGPFSAERAGSIATSKVIRFCFDAGHSKQELLKMITGKGGVTAHLGTNNMKEVMQRIEQGDQHAKLIIDAMIYNIAKWICSLAAVFCGKMDAILLTGGMAYSEKFIDQLSKRIEFLAPIHVYPGENEMTALAEAALAVLKGEMEAQEYS